MIDTNRGIVKYILLSFITCGIYGLWFLYKLALDVNIMCEGDGQNTTGLLTYFLLSIVTFGIYPFIWFYKLGNRLALNGPKYNLTFQEDGTTLLLWMILGSFLCGVGPLIALYLIIKNVNAMASAYNNGRTAM